MYRWAVYLSNVEFYVSVAGTKQQSLIICHCAQRQIILDNDFFTFMDPSKLIPSEDTNKKDSLVIQLIVR